MSDRLTLGEAADEAQWRALVEKGLKGGQWARLVGRTADGVEIQPLYRETDIPSVTDISGLPGAAPFVRAAGGWRITQSFNHPDPDQTNREILADLAGGVAAIELVTAEGGGAQVRTSGDLDRLLADVILEAAPVSLDTGGSGFDAAAALEAKLKGVAAPGVAFNLDPIGALMRHGAVGADDIARAAQFAARVRSELPNARAIRVDARPVHEAGGTEAQEVGVALGCGIAYLRALTSAGLSAADAAATVAFAVSVGPDVLIETAKLRALRLCWARVLEASGAPAHARAAQVHAFTSRRMMTRYDAWTNILRVTTSAFAAAIGGAQAITTAPFTDALGLPTPFARRVARNTQHVILEECRLGHVADPAGGAWFVERMTRDLATKAWEIMQLIESKGAIVAALQAGLVQDLVVGARTARQRLIATRRETITGVTDFPLLDETKPEFIPAPQSTGAPDAALSPIRWAEPFETLRDRAAAAGAPRVFFANIDTLAAFGPRAQWTRNLFAAGGIGAIGPEDAYATMDKLIDAFRSSRARVAVIASTDACYAEHAENCAQRLKAAGADWVLLAGKPGEDEARYRTAGVDQFVFAGADALQALETLHSALGIAK